MRRQLQRGSQHSLTKVANTPGLAVINIFCLFDGVAFAIDEPVAIRPIIKAIGTNDLLPVPKDDAGAVDVIRSVRGLITIDRDLRPYREGTLREAKPLRYVRRKAVH